MRAQPSSKPRENPQVKLVSAAKSMPGAKSGENNTGDFGRVGDSGGGGSGVGEGRESLEKAIALTSVGGCYETVEEVNASIFEESWSLRSFRIPSGDLQKLRPPTHRSQQVLPTVISRARPGETPLAARGGLPSGGEPPGGGIAIDGSNVEGGRGGGVPGARKLPQRQPGYAPATSLLRRQDSPGEAGWRRSLRKVMKGVGGNAVVPVEEESRG